MSTDYSHIDFTKVSRKDATRNEVLQAYGRILKDTMIGTVYYSAVTNGDDVFAVVVPTFINNRDWYNFGVKMMSEYMGPYCYDCPKSILDLLSTTDDENANEWRRICRARGNT